MIAPHCSASYCVSPPDSSRRSQWLLFFKLRLRHPTIWCRGKPGHIIAHLADIGRWVGAIEAYVKAPFRIGNFLVPIILVLAAVLVSSCDSKWRRAIAPRWPRFWPRSA